MKRLQAFNGVISRAQNRQFDAIERKLGLPKELREELKRIVEDENRNWNSDWGYQDILARALELLRGR